MTNSVSELFVECKPIDVSTKINIIDNLNSKYSFWKGGMSNNYLLVLRLIKHEICDYVTLIINQSLTTGIFPNKFKIAKVTPFQKGCCCCCRLLSRSQMLSQQPVEGRIMCLV